MTKKNFDARAERLTEYKKQIAELQKEADEIEAELKADMEKKELDEVQTEHFLVKWKEVSSNRLDSKALKAGLPEIYQQYCHSTTCKRFTMAAA